MDEVLRTAAGEPARGIPATGSGLS